MATTVRSIELPFTAAVPARLAARAGALLEVTRPRILVLVAATAAPVLAAGVPAGRGPAAAVAILAIALGGAAASAFNAVLERDLDALMERTRERPLPAGRLTPGGVLGFGVASLAAALAGLFAVGAPLAAALLVLTEVHYVGVYTAWLKRRTPLNIVIGGAAGATAPLILDAAIHGAVGPLSLWLAAIVTAWTPPHFWAIAAFRRDDYRAAGVPMLPVVAGCARARREGLAWAALLVPVSLGPAVAGPLSAAYAVAALVLGAYFLAALARAARRDEDAADRAAFRASVRYLALLVVAMAVDAALV
jgi:protoheme IX farnesyltransferase